MKIISTQRDVIRKDGCGNPYFTIRAELQDDRGRMGQLVVDQKLTEVFESLGGDPEQYIYRHAHTATWGA